MPNFTLFLDESGSVEYPHFDQRQPILAVGGVAISDDLLQHADQMISQFRTKSEWPWLESTTLRYSDIVSRRGPYGALKDETMFRTFLAELYERTIPKIDFTSFVCCVDKYEYMRQYRTRPIDRYLPQDPLVLAFTFVIERFVNFLHQKKSQGTIIYEHRDPKRNSHLQSEYVLMHMVGTRYLSGKQFYKVLPCWIEFVKKTEHNTGLQLADLVVGPTRSKVFEPGSDLREWGPVVDTVWKGDSPSSPIQLGFKVFPGELARELLGHPLARQKANGADSTA